jgi:polyphosphate kinase 2 (PPK2 family)
MKKGTTPARAPAASAKAPEKLKRNPYEEELRRLHGELVKLQQWIVHKGLKVCIVF